MQNKLQELTDKLYNEGLSKGKEAGAEILANSKKEAEEIIDKAQKEAQRIVNEAQKEAEDLKEKVKSDIKMASAQALQATKKDIENLVVSKIADLQVNKNLEHPEFVKEIISQVAKKFSTDEAMDLNILLPEKLKAELEPFIKNEIANIFKSEINAKFSKKINGGFTIGPKDGSYYISLTEETFNSLISEYIRSTTKTILFGDK